MISVYKGYFAIYWVVGALCVICAGLWSHFFDASWGLAFPVVVSILIITVIILHRLAMKKFTSEVISCYNECRVREFMDKLNKLLGNKRSKQMRSFYNYLAAMGYSALGDYDSLYECLPKITAKSHRTEYLKRSIDYYFYNDQIELAQPYIDELKTLYEKQRNKAYKASLQLFLKYTDIYIRVKNGNYEGAEEFFLGILNSPAAKAPITKASFSCGLAFLLIKMGDVEGAKPYLKTASVFGGDTRYKTKADKKLAELEQI